MLKRSFDSCDDEYQDTICLVDSSKKESVKHLESIGVPVTKCKEEHSSTNEGMKNEAKNVAKVHDIEKAEFREKEQMLSLITNLNRKKVSIVQDLKSPCRGAEA